MKYFKCSQCPKTCYYCSEHENISYLSCSLSSSDESDYREITKEEFLKEVEC